MVQPAIGAVVEQATWLTPTSLFVLLNVVIATILVSSALNKNQHKNQAQARGPHSGDYEHSNTTPPPQAHHEPQLARTPSLFSRVTSFDFSTYYPHTSTSHHDYEPYHHNQQLDPTSGRVTRMPSLLSRVASFNFSGRAQEPDPFAARQYNEDENEDVEPREVSQVWTQSKLLAAPAVTITRALSRVTSFNFSGLGRAGEPGPVEAREQIGEARYERREKEVDEQKQEENVMKVKKKKKKKPEAVAKEPTATKQGHGEVDAKADDFINRFKQQLKLQRLESMLRYRTAA